MPSPFIADIGDKELGEEHREKRSYSRQAGDFPIEECPHSTWAA